VKGARHRRHGWRWDLAWLLVTVTPLAVYAALVARR
jgi:hypothetical protein